MEIITKFEDLNLSKSYTYSDYLQWKFDERVELIKGFIKKMSPAPNRVHQGVSMRLSISLGDFFTHKNYQIFAAPFDVRLPQKKGKKNTTVVQPDLCVICDAKKLDDLGCNGAPDLIVEILSPGNSKHDTETKFKLYEEAGVPEYWIVSPQEQFVLVYILENERYIGLPPFALGTEIQSKFFPDLLVKVDDVFRDILKANN
jgi:Uma2 family endonuclease